MNTLLRILAIGLITASCSTAPPRQEPSPMKNAELCVAHKGDWVPLRDLYPGKELNSDDSRRYVCNIRTNDGGKACADDNECQGPCQAPADAVSGKPAIGSCSHHTWIVEGVRRIHNGVVDYPMFSEEMTDAKAARLQQLEANRAKWAAHRISNYKITLQDTDCYCLYGPYYGPIRITVRHGKIKRAIYLGEPRDGYRPGDSVTISTRLRSTIDELFDDLEHTIRYATENTDLKVDYDGEYGFPTLISYDRPDWEDEQSRLVVSDFKPARKPH